MSGEQEKRDPRTEQDVALPGDMTDSTREREQTHELDKLSRQFTARIEGLRELLDVMAPHVAALDQPAGLENSIVQSGLSDHGKEVIRNLFVHSGDSGDDAETPVVEIAPPGTGPPPSAQPVPPEELPAGIRDFSHVAQEEPGAVIRIMQRMTHGMIAPRSSLLHGSLLTVAVASFEFLVAGLFSFHLVAFPNQLKDDEQEFSLADLVELGSIEEARRILIERRADSFMRRALKDWSAWSEKVMGSGFPDLTMDFDHLNEVFQRRHIVVHSGGAVSRLYLERVNHSGDPPELGEELPVSADYMRAALDELEVLGHGLVALARSKWDSGNPDKGSAELNRVVYDLLRAERWNEARKLAEVGRDLAKSDASKWMLAVNGWLAARGREKLGECQPEIESWDVSALAHEFKLAKACLLGDIDEAFAELDLTLKESDRSPRTISQWPLLDDLRPDPRFLKTFERFGYKPDSDSEDSESEPSPEDPAESPNKEA